MLAVDDIIDDNETMAKRQEVLNTHVDLVADLLERVKLVISAS